MTRAERINRIVEDGGKLAFRKDGEVWLVGEATDYGVHCNPLRAPEDPYLSREFDWGDLPFNSDDLLAAHEHPTGENLKKLRLKDKDIEALRAGRV